jgi:ribosomal protein S18 acetylase RimI-like enzyme
MTARQQVNLPQTVRIRHYEPRDCGDVWRLHLEGVEQTASEYPAAMKGYEDDLRNIEETYLSEGSNFWVIDAPEGLAGMAAIFRIDAKTGRLRRMRITEAWRRRGLARALLDTAVEFCRESGYECVILDTTEQQTAAHKLYEDYGFSRTGERMIGPYRVFDYEMRIG